MTLAINQSNADTTSPDFYRDVYCILGLPFDAVSLDQAISKVRDAIESKTRLFLSTPNLNFLITSQTDPTFRNSVIHSDLSVADGMPIVWLARLLGVPIRERVAGASLFQSLRSAPPKTPEHSEKESSPVRVFFFGGPKGVAQAAHENINAGEEAEGARGYRVISVGYASPGFGTVVDMSTPAVIQQINASQADFLVVALGAAKGQEWIERNRTALIVPVLSHLGAVVNFVAGKIERAPTCVQRVGFEWLWRIKEEPALWRRYLADGNKLARIVLTRALPLAWIHYTKRPRHSLSHLQAIAVDERDSWHLVSLQGTWVHTNLGPLRTLFKNATIEAWHVKLDLQDVSYVDAAFLGILMLFADHQYNNVGAKLEVVASRFKLVNAIFKYAGLEYLLEKNVN